MQTGEEHHEFTEEFSADAGKTLDAVIRLFRLSEKPVACILDFALDEVIKLTASKVGYIYFFDEKTSLFTLVLRRPTWN